jgi:hypothetical protein
MQLLACAVCFRFCHVAAFIDLQVVSLYFFGLSLLSLLTSLGLSFWEISISVNALRLHLSGLMDDNL